MYKIDRHLSTLDDDRKFNFILNILRSFPEKIKRHLERYYDWESDIRLGLHLILEALLERLERLYPIQQ
jgi:hypothetical protein